MTTLAEARSGATGTVVPFLVLVTGVVAISYGAIFGRLADAHPVVVIGLRMTLATAVLAPLAWRYHRREIAAAGPAAIGIPLAAGAFLALHLTAWVASLGFTSIANGLVLTNLAPLWIALWATCWCRRPVGGACAASIALGLAGTVCLGLGSVSLGGDRLYGDGLATLGSVGLAGYLYLGRAGRQRLPFLAYVTLCYAGAAAVLLPVMLALGLRISGLTTGTYLAIAGMALVSQLLGHGSANWSLGHFRPEFVAVALLGEPVSGSLLGYAHFGEVVTLATVVGSTFVLTGIYVGGRDEVRRRSGAAAAWGDAGLTRGLAGTVAALRRTAAKRWILR